VTPTRCTDPRLAEQLLDLVQFTRRRSAQFSWEEWSHLEACASCRTAQERARRLALAYRSLQASDAEVSAARVRFVQRHRRPVARARRGRLLPRVIVVGLLLGLVAGAAAQIVVRKWAASKDVPRAHGEATRAGARSVHRSSSSSRPAEIVEPLVPVDGEPGGESPLASEAAPDVPPARVRSNRRAWAPIHRRAAASDLSAVPATERPTGVDDGAIWAAAAGALRAGDVAAAENALDRLAMASDARTRDAARLARAQLWLSQGRAARAREELDDLAATGATPTIRARARDGLEVHP